MGQRRVQTQMFAYPPIIALQILLTTDEVHRQVAEEISEKVRLGGEMHLPCDVLWMQPTEDEVIEVAVLAHPFLRRVIARAQFIAPQKSIGRIRTLQRIADKSKFETG